MVDLLLQVSDHNPTFGLVKLTMVASEGDLSPQVESVQLLALLQEVGAKAAQYIFRGVWTKNQNSNAKNRLNLQRILFTTF